MEARRRTPVVACAAAVVLALTASTTVLGYAQDTYNNSYDSLTTQSKNCWCAVATVDELSKYYGYTPTPSQSTVDAKMDHNSDGSGTGDKYDWSSGSQTCADGSHGHDPRGVAYGWWYYSPYGYGFNDYGYASRATASWELIYGIRADNLPVAVSIAAGYHELTVVGYGTAVDPFGGGANSINGFYVVDPWYPHNYPMTFPNANHYQPSNPPPYGLPRNTYITYSSWSSTFFLPDVHEGSWSGWYNKYVIVVRKSDSYAPNDNPPATYGDWYYNTNYGAVSGGLTPSEAAAASSDQQAPATYASIEAAVSNGLAVNGLTSGGKTHIPLRGFGFGPAVHVDSLSQHFASYDLVELRVHGTAVAIAMVTEQNGGFQFAALAPADASSVVTSSDVRSAALTKAALHGSGRLVWGWTKSYGSPFTPFIEGTDARGSLAYATIGGTATALQVASELLR